MDGNQGTSNGQQQAAQSGVASGATQQQAQNSASQTNQQVQNNASQAAGQPPVIDYEKIASLITGKQQVTEDTVLKSYFKQQGLSQDEMSQAISLFKAEKAKNQPDVNAMQTELSQYKHNAQIANIEKQATLEAVSLGLDAKTIPYVLKMANLSNAVDATGNLNVENIKSAINKVLEDVPALKPAVKEQNGFQVGSAGASQQSNSQTQEDMLKGIFGIK